MEEMWKDIKGYEGMYQISNLGKVKSLPRDTRNRFKNGRIMKPMLSNTGYYMIGLYKNRQYKRFSVHRLVALNFIPNPHNLSEINHKDENPKNNCVSNLEWCDRIYNINYGTQIERAHKKERVKVNQYDLNNNFIKTWDSITEAGLFYKTSHISACCRNKRNNAKGFIWKYADK